MKQSFPFANFNATEADRVVWDILYYRVFCYDITVVIRFVITVFFDNISTTLGYLSIVYSTIYYSIAFLNKIIGIIKLN